MKKINLRSIGVFTIIFALLMSPSLAVSDSNVALNQPVTLNGEFFTGGWVGGYPVDKATVVDGIFLPRSQEWDMGAVWWNTAYGGGGQNIVIDLQGNFSIESFIVQADDNDSYNVSYWDLNSNAWVLAYLLPAVGGWGMQTRPNPFDNSERYILGVPITTNALRIEADSGDGWYSVSEIQAYGTAVSEPATILLVCSGLLGLLGFRRRLNR